MAIPAESGRGPTTSIATAPKPPQNPYPAPPNVDWGGLFGVLTGDQTSQLKSTAGFDLSRLGVQGQQDAVQKQALLRQLGLMGAEQGLVGKQYQLQLGGFKQAEASDKYKEGRAEFQARGDAAASGAMGSPGEKRGIGDLRRELSDELATIGRERAKAGLDYQKSGLVYKEDKAQIGDALKQLALHGKLLGIDASQVKDRLQRGLDKAGLSSILSIMDLLNASGPVSGAQNQLNMAGGMMSYLLQLGAS